MLEIGRKDQEGSGRDLDDDLIGIRRRELRHRRPDDAGLNPWIVEVDRVRVRRGFQIVDAAEEIVGVTVHPMRRPRRIDVGPAPGDLDRVIPDFQESQDRAHRAVAVGHEPGELGQRVERVMRLPPLTWRQGAGHGTKLLERLEELAVHRGPGLGRELELPDQRREDREDVGARYPGHGGPSPGPPKLPRRSGYPGGAGASLEETRGIPRRNPDTLTAS